MDSAQSTVYLFVGDSLTEGRYGESYVQRIAQALSQGWHGMQGQAVNAGRGADTVHSLLARIDETLQAAQPQWVVVAVGSNDAWLPWLGAHSLGWWIWLAYRRLRWGQLPTRDLDRFAADYRALIERLLVAAPGRTVACTVSPLGEDLSSAINGQVARLNGVIKRVALDCRVPLADVWQGWVDELATVRRPSRYLPTSWWSAWQDRRRLRTASPDELSRRRRLRLTFDGIHLNCRGADLWAATVFATLARAAGREDNRAKR